MSGNSASQKYVHAYLFTFNDDTDLQSQFSTIVRAKLASLGLAEEDASNLTYKKINTDPFEIEVYVPIETQNGQIETSVLPQNELIFSDDSESDEPEVRTVTNKGAIRNPPTIPDPLP